MKTEPDGDWTKTDDVTRADAEETPDDAEQDNSDTQRQVGTETTEPKSVSKTAQVPVLPFENSGNLHWCAVIKTTKTVLMMHV